MLAGCLIKGRVVDENGAGMAGVTVTLSGDASITTKTGSNGDYQFGTLHNLLTAGSYTVTLSGDITPAIKNVPIANETLENGDVVPRPVVGVDFIGDLSDDFLESKAAITQRHYEMLGLNEEVAVWEDGMRTTGDVGTFEWWYFDAHLSDGSSFVITFFTKYMFDVSLPFNPHITVQIYKNDGTTVSKMYVAKEGEFSASTVAADVQIGNTSFTGDLENYEIQINIDELEMNVELERETPSFRPETGYMVFGDDEEYYFAWLAAVPQGKVTATITIDGVKSQLTGNGYHDHNWGNIDMNKVINNWYWARAHIDDYTVIASYIVAKKEYGYNSFPVFMVANQNEIVAANGNNVQFTKNDCHFNTATEKTVCDELVFDYVEKLKEYKVTFNRLEDVISLKLSDVSAYHRFLGDVTIEAYENGTETVIQGQALWELMYLGENIDQDLEPS